ncbi:MAG: hypothetical protein D6722_10495, partial [Bacteroidetes bacterium]
VDDGVSAQTIAEHVAKNLEQFRPLPQREDQTYVPIRSLLPQARLVETQLMELERQLEGDRSLSSREFETPPSLSDRLGVVTWGLWESTSAPTGTMRVSFDIASREFETFKTDLAALVKAVEALETELEKTGAPYTPGRRPGWSQD